MEDLKPTIFSIKAKIDGKMQEIKIQTRESTDGVSFYFCEIDGEKISQLRKEENWQQIWGNLTKYEIIDLGLLINQYKG